jgi:hypothetical protein
VILAEWTAHPAKRRPQDIALVAMVTLVFCGAVLASLQSVWLTVLAAIILVIATAPFLFPTRYQLTDEGVFERRLGRERGRKWSELRRYQLGKGAALVSPFRRPSALERYRGLILYLDGSDRRTVESILAERIVDQPEDDQPEEEAA